LITVPRQLPPANALQAVKLGAIAQRQLGPAACLARPPEPPAMPSRLVDDLGNPAGPSDHGRDPHAGVSHLATRRG
jgi:hypothetical protein